MKDMLEIYLTRHGETQWNKIKRMQGQGNSPLTDFGIKQAEWLAQRLKSKEFTTIYTSPLGRAKDTAVIVNSVLTTELIEDDRLKEIFMGDWEGRLVSELEEAYPKENDAFWHNPVAFEMKGKESFQEVRDRAADFFEELIRKHEDGKILIVAHAIILKGMMNYIQGSDITKFWEGKHILPTSVTKISVIDNRTTVTYLADTSHHKEPMTQGWFIEE